MSFEETRGMFEILKDYDIDAVANLCFDYLPYDKREEVVEHLAYELGIDIEEI